MERPSGVLENQSTNQRDFRPLVVYGVLLNRLLLLGLQGLCISNKEHIVALLQHGPDILGIDQWEQDRCLVDRVWDESRLKKGREVSGSIHQFDRECSRLV